MKEQLKAADDVEVVYFTKESETALALRLLVVQEGHTGKIAVAQVD